MLRSASVRLPALSTSPVTPIVPVPPAVTVSAPSLSNVPVISRPPKPEAILIFPVPKLLNAPAVVSTSSDPVVKVSKPALLTAWPAVCVCKVAVPVPASILISPAGALLLMLPVTSMIEAPSPNVVRPSLSNVLFVNRSVALLPNDRLPSLSSVPEVKVVPFPITSPAPAATAVLPARTLSPVSVRTPVPCLTSPAVLVPENRPEKVVDPVPATVRTLPFNATLPAPARLPMVSFDHSSNVPDTTSTAPVSAIAAPFTTCNHPPPVIVVVPV